MTALAFLIILATLIRPSLTGEGIPDVSQNYQTVPVLSAKRVNTADYKYVLKVVAQGQNLGLGAYVKPLWVLTSQFFESVHEVITVGTWDWHMNETGRGQYRHVAKIYVNPLRSIDACNFDLAMLKLNESFEAGPSVGYISYRESEIPIVGDLVQIPLPIDDEIQAKSVVINRLMVCDDHYSYYLYSACTWTIFCLEIGDRLYGAPIMKDDKLVGIMPSEIDERVQKAVFHFITDYRDWLDAVAKAIDKRTSTVVELLLTDVTILFLFNYWNT